MGSGVHRSNYQLRRQMLFNGTMVQQRPTVSFEQLLGHAEVPRVIDYLSLDIEGAEALALRSFPFGRYAIRVISVEHGSGASHLPPEYVCLGVTSGKKTLDSIFINVREMPDARTLLADFRHPSLRRTSHCCKRCTKSAQRKNSPS